MKVTDALLDLLFPPKCPFCQKVQDAPGMCPECEASLPWTDEAHSLRTLEGGLLCAAPLWYEGPVREAVRRFKFHGGVCAAGPLGECIAQAAAERLSGRFDAVTWVPVSAKRLRKRGYDQSRLLAERACRLWDVEPEALLRKVRDNPAQSSLERAEDRWKNTQGVYEAAGSPAGKRILLIDDVCSTGSTLVSAAKALLEAGAAGVVCTAGAFPRPEEEIRGEKGKE
ncbi:MAG: ComF family protein [Oscillibacter sp.]|nr:ComF family protein [Oscillibacter sp.]